jgi:hypothetical protein
MPSIFIWKVEEPNTSKKQIRYYSGSNWTLEDNDFSSKSYIFLDQIVIPGFNDSVITYRAKQMPQDWVGTELLEVSNVPFEQIKSDNYGTLDKIGNWMRFISKNEIEFDTESLQNEVTKIKKWMSETNPQTKSLPHPHQKPHYQKQNNTLLPSNVNDQFQQFLIKYNVPIPGQNIALPSTNQLIINNINTVQSNSKINPNKNNYKKNNNKSHLNKNNFVLK